MSEERSAEISGELSEAFSEIVSVEIISEQLEEGVGLVVCNMSYRPRGSDHDTHRSRIRQTAVVLNADDLDLPKFSLAPRISGVVGTLFSMLGGTGDLEFSDSPEFNTSYRLHGWAEEPVRILFTQTVRDFFSDSKDWSVIGQGRQLVIFRRNVVIEEAELPDFIREALNILTILREAEKELDNRPDVRRDITGDDLLKASDRMGIFGSVMAAQFRKISITEEELADFYASPPPRRIPPGMKRQVVGDNLPLVFIGGFFLIAGIVAGSLILAFAAANDRWISALFFGISPVIGGALAGITLWHRNRKIRLLREGVLAGGQVTKVSTTSTQVNGQVRNIVHVTYQLDGRERKTTCYAYSTAADRARRFKSTGQTVQVLVDPKDPNHVTCTDFLLLFST